MTNLERKEVTKSIKQNLKRRTGITWSVTGNTGTAWSWITIEAPKARRVFHDNNPDYDHMVNGSGASVGLEEVLPWIERQAEEGETGWYTSEVDRKILAETLGIGMNFSSSQGVSISPDMWDFYLDRAKNGPPESEPKPEAVVIEFIPLPEVEEVIESQIEDVESSELIQIRVPNGNKRSHIEEYLPQLENEDDYRLTDCKVERIVILTNKQYDAFIDGNLLTSFDWLAGMGGNDSTTHLAVREWEDYTQDEQAEWRKHSYILAVKVVSTGRPVLYVDPQGHNFARYVGFPLKNLVWNFW